MKTLLQIGDVVKIREDIQPGVQYKMRLGGHTNSWVGEMAKPGSYVTIVGFKHGQYVINSENIENFSNKICEEFWNYTDDMFDQDIIDYLYIEHVKNNK
jgi:hypothetical protein